MTPCPRIRVLDLGAVRVRPDNLAGTWRPMLWWTATARTWTSWLPIHAFLIEHPSGLVLFDTGQAADSLLPGYYPPGLLGWIYRRQAQFTVEPEQSLDRQLAGHGVAIGDLDRVVVSHLHQDHAGNLPAVGATPVHVHEAEFALASGDQAPLHGILASRVIGPRTTVVPVQMTPSDDPWLEPFDSMADLYGDGLLTLLPTPGHTKGSMSLLARLPGCPPVLLVGDVTYDLNLMRAGVVPGTGDTAVQRATTAKINELCARHPDLMVAPSHDAAAAARLN